MTDLTERLALIIDARTDGAVTNIRKLSLEEKAAADRAELLQAKIADLNTRIARSGTGGTATQQRQLANMNSEYKALTSNLGNVPAAASKVENALAKVGLGGLVSSSTLGAATKALPGLAAGALAFGEFDFLKSGVRDYVELADEIRNVAQAASSSVPDASRLVAVTHALGLNSDSAALGLFRLGKNIDAQPQKLAALGISIARTKDGNTDLIGTLFNVADAYQHTADASERAGLVQTAFGRAGVTMLPILNANRRQLEEIAKEAAKQGRVFNPEDLQRARDYQIETRELQTAWQSLAITAGRTLVPALSDVAGILTKVADATHSSAFNVAKWIVPGYQVFRLAKFGLHLAGVGGGGGSAAADAASSLAAQQDQAAADARSSLVDSSFGSPFDTLAAPTAVRKATDALTAARRTLDSARRQRENALAALSTTQQAGTNATDLAAAQARVDAAQASLRQALYLGGDARIAQARSTLASAQKSLNDAQAGGVGSTARLTAGQNRLADANQRVKAATNGVKDAEHALSQARGLTAQQALDRVTRQAHDAARKVHDEEKLLARGLTPDVVASLVSLDQQLPGTLDRVTKTMHHGIVAGLNREFANRDASKTLADSLVQGDAFANAGKAAGHTFVQSFAQVLENGLPFTGPLPKGARRSSGPAPTLSGLLTPPGVTVHGNIVVHGKNARQVAHDIARKARLRALSSGGGQEHYGWDD